MRKPATHATTRWKVGELAKAAGTTVRTLHHYESLGFLEPPRDASSGHRVYGVREIERLQRVLLLRRLGFSLDQVGKLIDGPGDLPLVEVVRLHRRQLERQANHLEAVLKRVEGLEAILESGGHAPIEDLFSLLEMTMNFERYYTEEQLEQLRQRRETLGEDGMRKGQQDWQDLISEVREAEAAGVSPTSPRGEELARRWEALIKAFTGGDAGIRASLETAYQDQPGAMERFGIKNEMMDWIDKARAVL